MKNAIKGLLATAALALGTQAAQAANINVLIYGGSFDSTFATLAATANTYDPAGDGSNTWSVSYWNAGDPTPNFNAYNVLVIGSWVSSPIDPTRLYAANAAITAARGSRTFLTGQDGDFHHQNGPGAVDNGPRGFLINAINWAGSGTGLNIVSLADGWAGSGSNWWLNTQSFLRSELLGAVEYFQSDTVALGVGQESFPVNEGITNAGLSNWSVSSHLGFNSSLVGYTPINYEGLNNTGRAITVVTLGQAGGGTQGGGGQVPVPATLGLVGLALALLANSRGKANIKA